MATKTRSVNDALLLLKEKFIEGSQKPGIQNYEPYTYPDSGRSPQKEFHTSEARGKLFIGGNRSGKTVGGGAEAVMRLTGQHRFRHIPRPPIRGRAIGVDFKQGIEKIIKPEIQRWMPPSFLKNGSWEDSYDKELKTLFLTNGSFLEFMSYEQDVEKFAGTSRHFCWFDEEPPEEIFNECMMRLVDTKGDWWITMTPLEGMTWVYHSIYEPWFTGQNPQNFVVEVDTLMNPYIDQESRKELLFSLDEEDIKAREKGEFVSRTGLIYPHYDKQEIKNTIEPFVPDRRWLWCEAMDHGYHNPTAWGFAAISPDGEIFVFDEHYESGLTVREHAKIIHERRASYKKRPGYVVGDPSIRNRNAITGTSVQSEYAEQGIFIALANNDVAYGLNRVAQAIRGTRGRPKLYLTENCVNTKRDLVRLRWAAWANKKDDKQKNKKEEQHKYKDHGADMVRYLVASRPETMDNGTYIPEYVPPVGGPSVPSDMGVTPEMLEYNNPNLIVDEYMGSEW